MADKKFEQYTEETTVTNDDLFLVKEKTGGATKRVQAQNILPAGSVGTVDVADSAVTTAKLNNGAVTDGKMDYPRWWQEIGRTTLGSTGSTITVSGLPARKYLYITVTAASSGGAVSNVWMRFNNDSGNNYSRRNSNNGGADATATSSNVFINVVGSGNNNPMFIYTFTSNIANQEKLGSTISIDIPSTGAANAPSRNETISKWANTSDQITRVDVIASSNNFAAGSEVVVLGHD